MGEANSLHIFVVPMSILHVAKNGSRRRMIQILLRLTGSHVSETRVGDPPRCLRALLRTHCFMRSGRAGFPKISGQLESQCC